MNLNDIEMMDFKKKSKEEKAQEWAGFMKEQVAVFDKLLIEKGIKKQETIKIGNT